MRIQFILLLSLAIFSSTFAEETAPVDPASNPAAAAEIASNPVAEPAAVDVPAEPESEPQPAAESEPAESQPEAESEPAESQPEAESEPAESQPEAESEPAESEPAESQPEAESEPAESQPEAESEPAESQPEAESEPAEFAPAAGDDLAEPDNTTTTTTTTTTTSTTPVPTTVVPPAKNDYLYNVTEKNITCIMLEGKLLFKVTYNIGANKTNISSVSVPEPSSDVNVTGTCATGAQYIEITWGNMGLNSIRIDFEESSDKKTWHISNFTSAIYLNSANFFNASDEGKVLVSDIAVVTNPAEIPVNHSLRCYSGQTFNNVTTTKEGVPYTYPVELIVENFQLQAFNKISDTHQFVEDVHCDADKIADVVPIAVGCALAALVVVVLIAYIIGRRRRSAAYQSV